LGLAISQLIEAKRLMGERDEQGGKRCFTLAAVNSRRSPRVVPSGHNLNGVVERAPRMAAAAPAQFGS